MKKKYLPLIALAAGFIWALITAGLHSLLFSLLPLLAFVFGYFSSWKRGLLNGFLLFLGYTMATAIMWRGVLNAVNLLTYFYTFISGGFSLLLIGALAPVVRRGIRKIGSVVVLVILAFLMVWSGFQAWPTYSYYYQIIIHSSENLDDLELYLPAGVVSGDIYEELYNNPFEDPMAPLTKEYTQELVATEHGRMLKFTIDRMSRTKHPELPYCGNIIFEQRSAPPELIHLMPRYDVVQVNTMSWGESIGPVIVKGDWIVEEFVVPVKIYSQEKAEIELRLENRTDRGEMINFTYGKSNTYTELVKYEGKTSDGWLLVPVKVTNLLRIRGTGD